MRKKKQIACILLAAVMAVGFVVSFYQRSSDASLIAMSDEKKVTWWRPQNDIIREIVQTYYWNQENSYPRLEKLYEELSMLNPEGADKWKKIIEFWNYTNSDLEINMDILPDGLDETDSLCLLIMGFELNPDGTMKKELLGRMDVALECAKKYPNAQILCTGGPTAFDGKGTTEGGVMAEWLIENGIDESRIFIEDRSLTTIDNVKNAYQIICDEHPEITDIALITSDYHVPWSIVLWETKFILGNHPLHVVSNAAFNTEWVRHPLLEIQSKGILQVSGLY